MQRVRILPIALVMATVGAIVMITSPVTTVDLSPQSVLAPTVITVRANGDQGTENIELHINNTTHATWENISTTPTDYTYTINQHITIFNGFYCLRTRQV